MDIKFAYMIGMFLCVSASLFFTLPLAIRLCMSLIGASICLSLLFFPIKQRAVQKLSFSYPCNTPQDSGSISTLASQIKNLNIEADSTIMHDDPFLAHCGDEVTSYLLKKTSSNGWLYSGETINVIANNPIEQYENQLEQ